MTNDRSSATFESERGRKMTKKSQTAKFQAASRGIILKSSIHLHRGEGWAYLKRMRRSRGKQ